MSDRLAELHAVSASPDELVLPYKLAVEAVTLLSGRGTRLFGWEGWVRRPNGAVGHSSHQGTMSLDHMCPADAATLMLRTLEQAARQFAEHPDRQDAELLFCITYDDGR